jgi:hypothetical protein
VYCLNVIWPLPLGSNIPNIDCKLVSSNSDGGLREAIFDFRNFSRYSTIKSLGDS